LKAASAAERIINQRRGHASLHKEKSLPLSRARALAQERKQIEQEKEQEHEKERRSDLLVFPIPPDYGLRG
jgi:hypothetical protein